MSFNLDAVKQARKDSIFDLNRHFNEILDEHFEDELQKYLIAQAEAGEDDTQLFLLIEVTDNLPRIATIKLQSKYAGLCINIANNVLAANVKYIKEACDTLEDKLRSLGLRVFTKYNPELREVDFNLADVVLFNDTEFSTTFKIDLTFDDF